MSSRGGATLRTDVKETGFKPKPDCFTCVIGKERLQLHASLQHF